MVNDIIQVIIERCFIIRGCYSASQQFDRLGYFSKKNCPLLPSAVFTINNGFDLHFIFINNASIGISVGEKVMNIINISQRLNFCSLIRKCARNCMQHLLWICPHFKFTISWNNSLQLSVLKRKLSSMNLITVLL